MITFIAFLLTMTGCINWLLIGMLQYDFIAGLFGYQASIFSRIFYILFGIGAIYLFVRMIANKGSVKIYEKRKKKDKQEKVEPSYLNVETARENVKNDKEDSLFDEHLKKNWPLFDFFLKKIYP